MTNREIISLDNWFKNHPDNVLGEAHSSTNQFGESVTIIKSSLPVSETASKIIGDLPRPEINPWFNDIVYESGPKQTADRISEAIKKTQELISNPPDLAGHDMIGFDEMQQRYGGNLTDEEYRAWVWYNTGKAFSPSAIRSSGNGWSKYLVQVTPEIKANWIAQGIVGYDGENYLPAQLFYAGNIYSRIEKVRRNEDDIVSKHGRAYFEKVIADLEAVKPPALSLMSAEDERLYISPLDPFAQEMTVTSLANGTVLDEETSLLSAFQDWLREVPAIDFKNGSNSYEINNYFLGNSSFPRGTDPAEKVIIKRRSQTDCIHLFSRFLHEVLTREDQQIIAYTWNSIYNNWREYDYAKIPVGFEINRYFKNAPVDPRPALWEGVKFLNIAGSGGIAFDVGVGKTMTAILALAQALYTGQCKRPLVVVPNPTYKKWIGETVGIFDETGKTIVNGVLPQYKDRINDFYNLGVDVLSGIENKIPKDYTITFITYEGLEALGFGQSARDLLESQLFRILNQGGLKPRDMERLREDIDKILGSVTSETLLTVDDLGFDYIVVDEAHNFKKIFTRVKGRETEEDDDRQASPYQLSSGEPSGRGLKLFAICQYILQTNNLRNVALLTATPFTNSPLEIYSMLSLVAYQQLEKRGIINLIDFFDKFINEVPESVVTIRGRYETRPVIKTFNNRQVLQNIIFSSFLYKTGEEAGVPRPIKITLPLIKDDNGIFLPPEKRIDTSLQPTVDQAYWMREIARFANAQPDNAIEPFIPADFYDDNDRLLGRDLIAISLGQSVTLSPYLMRIGGEEGGISIYESENPTYIEFVESSPKLLYVTGCCKSVRDYHISRGEPVSGQVIYMNRATSYFPLIKEYLVNVCGYATDEVEIISGGITQAKKERIKQRFLDGVVKIIIGSATIKEGIDLQNKSTVLYNCNLDWNPTDIQQLEGRIWRQGNMFSYVRINTPMIENSLDVFLFQKLEEKTSRINDLWYRKGRGNVLRIEDFDPKELKLGLMTDPAEKVRAEIALEVQVLETELNVAQDTITKIKEVSDAIADINSRWEELNKGYDECYNFLDAKRNQQKSIIDTAELNDLSKTDLDRATSKYNSLSKLLDQEITDKVRLAIFKRYAKEKISESDGYSYESTRRAYRIIEFVDKQLRNIALLDTAQKNILGPRELTVADDLNPVIEEITGTITQLTEKISDLKSKETFDRRVREAQELLAAKKLLSKTVPERVAEFEKQNYLLSCLKGIHVCDKEGRISIIGEEAKQPESGPTSDDKAKRLRLAKAKAAALKLKLKLAA